MHLVSIIRGSFVLALGLFAAGCAVDTGDSDGSVDPAGKEEKVATAGQAIVVDTAGAPTTHEWNSGEINNLSAWEELDCTSTYGGNHMMTGLRAFRENQGNLDQFIGKMGGECTDYSTVTDLQTVSQPFQNIFTGPKYRTPGIEVTIPGGARYPTALELEVNQADGYVKDVRLGSDGINVQGTAITHNPTFTAWATGYSGTNELLACEDQRVLTSVRVRYDLSRAKIRRIQIECRLVSF